MNAFRYEGAKEWMEMPQDLMYIGWTPLQLILILLVVVLLFGKGKISDVMGDVAKGIKSFKKGLSEDDTQPAPPQSAQPPSTPKPIDHEPARTEAKTPTGTETKA
jgi:sec-independent protein translocase protein TatA